MSSFIEIHRERSNDLLAATLQRDYPSPRLGDAINYACLNGGKRLRAVLVYASAQAVGGNIEAADSAALAIELLHSYSLVHDDLPAMDDDDLRRGKPTVHKQFDEATAILVGDALQSIAFEVLTRKDIAVSPTTNLRMIKLFAQAAGAQGMVGGQAVDFEATGQSLSLPDLEIMHQLKTGELIECATKLGALSCPEVSEEQIKALSNYARQIGLAFQVQDDILDETSDTSTLGKPQGSDKAMDKPTYVSLLGLENAKKRADQLRIDAIAHLQHFDHSADPLREIASFITSRQA
ncbi:MAG: polyprenyl synthetase family protein [Pseudohongiellaceae bacterium]